MADGDELIQTTPDQQAIFDALFADMERGHAETQDRLKEIQEATQPELIRIMEESARWSASDEHKAMLSDLGVNLDAPIAQPNDLAPYVDPAPDATAEDVAQWMADEIAEKGRLKHSTTVSRISRTFGRKFLYANEHGNSAISVEVLDAFMRKTPDVVWAFHSHYWRKRKEGDPPDSRRVKE